MAIQHKDITEANLHEAKGVSTATVGRVYVSNGAGSGTWLYPNPHGSVSFSSVAAPTTVLYPAVYAKALVTTVVSGLAQEFTEATTARLTYTGTLTRPFRATCNLYLDQSAGAIRNIRAALYKNGAIIPLSESMTTTTSGEVVNVVLTAELNLATNDYIEAYIRNDGAGGDVRFYAMFLACMAIGRT